MVTDVLVQKYGGSSLSTLDRVRGVARRVAAAHTGGRPTVVVVSARGDTTDALIGEAAALGTAPDARELDQLLATGECASAALLAIGLRGLGVPAVSLTGRQAGIRVAGRHGAGRIDEIDTTRLERVLAGGSVAVVAGFQGTVGTYGADDVDDADDVVTLGRGGSDTTAVALAAAIGARDCEIYTDVDGIYTADPRIVPTARKIPFVRPDVMAEMAFAGARVLHSRSVELAAMAGVPVHVRASVGDQSGTIVAPRGSNPMLETTGAVVAVTHDTDVARVLVRSRGGTDLAAEVLDILARHCVPVDLVARSGPDEDEFRMGFTIRRSDVPEVRAALEAAAGAHGGQVRVDTAVGKVSLIGMGLLNRPEYVARMAAALARAGIATSWVSTSQLRASVTVHEGNVADSVVLLHREFGLEQTESAEPVADLAMSAGS
ncbi:aspartate kinase [Actinokineospora enzanensis]|uniref:aspartate kinase n=1 Tax=Actinokineospora enzanensis TaxID=155975 RepID=UPI00036073EF|nr:aspartate kinase [Actinokineospora enzanensis]